MALQIKVSNLFPNKAVAFSPPSLHLSSPFLSSSSSSTFSCKLRNFSAKKGVLLRVQATIDRSISSGSSKSNNNSSNNGDCSKKEVPNSNYVVPLDKSFSSLNSSCMTRPLIEILRDLNKRIPDNIVTSPPYSQASPTYIPWYHANRMLSFYAPGWCGEIRDVIFSENGGVTVVYRVTIRGSDGEAYRESSGTVTASDSHIVDPVAAAEEIAFCKACARFGLGLYLYHEE